MKFEVMLAGTAICYRGVVSCLGRQEFSRRDDSYGGDFILRFSKTSFLRISKRFPPGYSNKVILRLKL